jgi:hypothetical protein
MGATTETIWRVPAYLPYVQPPLTDEAVALAEAQIGYKLPAEYLRLLSKQNGGYIRYALPEMVHDVIAGIGPHFPSLTDFDWDEVQEYVSFPLRGLVPFDGDGHWHICLDYRRDAVRPSVTYADVECDHESPIASSFPEYMAMLRLDVRDKFVIEAVRDVETLKAALASLLAVQFDPPDIWNSGYAIHRAALGSEGSPEWVWLSPNTVPRGFVRPEDPRYRELKDLMPGHAQRYPEAPVDGYILTATDGVRAAVIDACARGRLTMRPLGEYVANV